MDILALRGAITVSANRADEILAATAELLRAMADANDLVPERIVFLFFTATPDLDAAFPASAAARLGWGDVPRMGAVEVAVPGAPERCVRVLALVRGAGPGKPVYLRDARALVEAAG